ncbi:unnamed protein product [Jaminaea pallidilutea]
MTKAALSAIPPSASQAHFADDIVSMCLTMQRSCRKPASWKEEWGAKPDNGSPRNGRTRVVAVARLSSSRKDEDALFAKLQQLVAPTVREVWPVIGKEGTVDEAIAGTHFFTRVGSAIAGMEDTGSHAVWEDVIRQELPRADVLLVFGLAGFVLDLPSWLYAMAHAGPDLKLLFRHDANSLWLLDREEILAHCADSGLFFAGSRPQGHPFMAFADGEARRRFAQIGLAMEAEPRRYEAMVSTPPDATVFFGASQLELRRRQVTQGLIDVVCPVCKAQLLCGSIWEMVAHLLHGHGRDTEQPWTEGRGDSAVAKRALGWVNKHLKAINSPLAVECVLDEYDRRTSATAANNNNAAVRAVIKKGNDGGKTKAKSSSSRRIVKADAPCPCFDTTCPAPESNHGEWTPKEIAAHAIEHHEDLLVCKWKSIFKCGLRRPTELGLDALAAHIAEHEQKLRGGVVPEQYADALADVQAERADAGGSSATDLKKRRYGS